MKTEAQVVAKGQYKYPQSALPVKAEQYVFMQEKEEKYLLLRFANERAENVSALRLRVTQYDDRGGTLSSETLELDGVNGAAGAFVLKEKIGVDAQCDDFRVEVLAAEYGRYRYLPDAEGVRVEYADGKREKFDAAAAEKKMRGHRRTVAVRRYKFSPIICFFSVLLFLCLLVPTVVYLSIFTKTSVSFLYDDVEYTFVGGDRSDGSDIFVSGWRGRNKEIVIPVSVEGHEVRYIGEGAFEGNRHVQSIAFETALDLGARAFEGCTSLRQVDFSKTATIGEGAFRNCTSLVSVVSSAISAIGQEAFEGCTALAEVTLSGEAEGGMVAIGARAFADCTALTAFTAEEIAFSLNKNILAGCTALETLAMRSLGGRANMPANLPEIFGVSDGAGYALREVYIGSMPSVPASFCAGFAQLQSVVVDTVGEASVGERAFDGCASLVSVDLGAPIVSVGYRAFADSGIRSFDTSALQTVGSYAFAFCTDLSDFAAESSGTLVSLGDGAFEGCTSLNAFGLPASLSSLGEGALADCTALRSVTFSDGIELQTVPARTFSGCSVLTGVVLPAGVTAVGDSAFEGCVSLTAAELPDGVRSVGAAAFSGCTQLRSAVLPSSVTSVGKGVFRNCAALVSLSLPFAGGSASSNGYLSYLFGSDSYYDASAVPRSLMSVALTGGAPIASYAFYGCAYLNRIVVSAGTSVIGSYAFAGCYRLYEVVNLSRLPLAAGSFSYGGVAQYALNVCTSEENSMPTVSENGFTWAQGADAWHLIAYPSRQNLSLPASFAYQGARVTSYALPAYLFYMETGLTGATVSSAVTQIGQYAFYGDNGLQTLTFAANSQLGDVGNFAFCGCTSLLAAHLPASVGRIGNCAFYGCSSLRSVTLSESLVSIESQAFDGCVSLREIVDHSAAIEVNAGAAHEYENGGVGKYALVVSTAPSDTPRMQFVTVGGVDYAYIGGDWWILGTEADVSSLAVTSISYGGITARSVAIASYAFENSYGLRSLSLGDLVTEVGEYAFSGCFNLSSLTIGSGLNTVGMRAFASCRSLERVSMPFGMRSIGEYAFADCGGLRSVVLPNSSAVIGEGAFENCTKLYEVYNPGGYPLAPGGTGCGGAARYALVVYDSADAESALAESGDFIFLREGNAWKLVKYTGGTGGLLTLTLPSSFVHGSETVSSYTLRNGVFTGWFSSVVIPVSVQEIENGAFASFPYTVYYMGTQEAWADLSAGVSGASSANVYYYAACVHERGQWTYRSGNISTSVNPSSWITVTEPGCETEGLRRRVCTACGATLEEQIIPPNGHTLDENGVCIVCGEAVGETDTVGYVLMPRKYEGFGAAEPEAGRAGQC